MALVWFCTREDVKAALPISMTARMDRQIDQAIGSGARTIEGETHRFFRPVLDTRFFDWPNLNTGRSWRLWLDANELITATTVTVAGVAIPASDYFLEPDDYGPPYDRLEIDLASAAAFTSASGTHQRAIGILGLYGWDNTEEQVGQLTSELTNDPLDTASATWSTPHIGVGDVLRIDSERVVVSQKTMVDSGQNCSTLTAVNNDVLITGITAGTIAIGQVILVDGERMLVVDVAGTTLVVKRAWDGTVLAAHSSGADIFIQTGVDLDRAQLGTTIATHATSSLIFRHVVPDLVRDYNKALAINQVLQETSGYARVVGSGDYQMEASGKGIAVMCQEVRTRYGRKARHRAV